MIPLSPSASLDCSWKLFPQLFCPCRRFNPLSLTNQSIPFSKRKRRRQQPGFARGISISRRKWSFFSCAIPSEAPNSNFNDFSLELADSTRRGAKIFVVKRFSDELDGEDLSEEQPIQVGSNFTNFQEDPIVDKLRTQLGVIHPIPSPPISRSIAGLFVFFFFVGIVFDKVWTYGKRKKVDGGGGSSGGGWPQVPTSFSLFLEKDLQRKESVEWVNMVLGKLWKVYRGGIENWIIGLLQPVIDDLKKPDYVERVEIRQFSLGDEPLSVRNVERRTSRRVNDLHFEWAEARGSTCTDSTVTLYSCDGRS